MKKPNGSPPAFIVSIVIATICGVVVNADIPSSSDSRDPASLQQGKSIERVKFVGEPFRIEVKSKGRKIKVGEDRLTTPEKFEDVAEDWLKNVQIEFKNTSEKPVVSISLDFRFPETSSTGVPMLQSIHLGKSPISQRNPTQNNNPISIIPQDIVTIQLSDETYGELKKFLATRGHTPNAITKLRIGVYLVYYSDGSKWDNGKFYIPDPTQPHGYAVDPNGWASSIK